jgi:hypothetical protein
VRTEDEEIGFCFSMSHVTSDGWIIDTGATHHLCRDKRRLHGLRNARRLVLTGMRGVSLSTQGCGSVFLHSRLDDIRPVMLEGVLFSPDASTNIIAVKPFIDEGCSVLIVGEYLVVCKQHTEILRGKKDCNGLYVLSSHVAGCAGADRPNIGYLGSDNEEGKVNSKGHVTEGEGKCVSNECLHVEVNTCDWTWEHDTLAWMDEVSQTYDARTNVVWRVGRFPGLDFKDLEGMSGPR